MFKEKRLIHFSGGPEFKGTTDPEPYKDERANLNLKQPEKKLTLEKTFNRDALKKYVEGKIDRTNSDQLKKLQEKIKKKGWSQDINDDFCKNVLGLKIEGRSKEQINIIIKGFQQEIKTRFPKAADLKVDGKFGKKFAEALLAMDEVENSVYYPIDDIIFVSVEDMFGKVDVNKVSKCGKIKDKAKRNEFFWKSVLGLEMPNGNPKEQAKSIKDNVKQLQNYMKYKSGKSIDADGQVGPQTLDAFAKLVKPAVEFNDGLF